MNLVEWLWRRLPDNCEVRKLRYGWKCPGKGVRGNENIERFGVLRVVMCDDCSAHLRRNALPKYSHEALMQDMLRENAEIRRA